MNFTAQGYAKITSMIQPDIAVLEGGYSIEGALPYINVGIVLAMAGLDYGKVIEPDNTPDKTHQPGEVTDWINSIKDITLKNWSERETLRLNALNSGEYAERNRSIYYDTDNIGERQKETIRVCPDCAGVIKIASSSDLNKHVLAVHIPLHACDTCKEIGHSWYESADAGTYDQAMLQDRTEDRFLSKNL